MLLRGVVELDEGFVDGRHAAARSRGRCQPDKALVAMAVEHKPGGGLGCAHLRVAPYAGAKSLSAAAAAAAGAAGAARASGRVVLRGQLGRLGRSLSSPQRASLRASPGRDVRAGRSWTERGGHETVPS